MSFLAIAADPRDATSERILDAALAAYVKVGIRGTTMEDIAERAGLSRVTVHRRFSRKSDLTRAVIFRELQSFLVDFEAAISDHRTMEDQLAEGFVVTLRAARTHPLVTRVLRSEPDLLLPELTVRGGPFLAIARDFLVEAMRARHPRLVGRDAGAIGELFIRVTLSFILTPQSAVPLTDDRAARAYARRYLVPLIGATQNERAPTGRARRR